MKPLSLGFSPCPNDTFIFYSLVKEITSSAQPFFEAPSLEDVETLNRWAFETRLDVTKLSFNAVGHLLDTYCILQSGSALGHGCGPLLVAARDMSLPELDHGRIAIPGTYTTAALLLRMFLPGCSELVEMRFEEIMPAVASGDVAAGVIIHESRFTYQRLGLVCLQDLGQWWENVSGLPIPLGCIAARRDLGAEKIKEIDQRIRKSLLFSRKHPGQSMDYIRQYAQETEDEVILSHIGLYVNDYSLDLGAEGRLAVESFFSRGREAGGLPDFAGNVFSVG